jgi:hypothetical protein
MAVQMYASATSVAQGGSLDFYLSSDSAADADGRLNEQHSGTQSVLTIMPGTKSPP